MRRRYNRTVLERFEDHYVPEPNTGCWIWTGATTGGNKGHTYGIFCPDSKRSGERKLIYAHRWSYEHFVSPIQGRNVVDHKCRNKLCVNYKHLESVTSKVNNKRRYKDGPGI